MLSFLKVGAFPLDMFVGGEYTFLGDCGVSGIQIFSRDADLATLLACLQQLYNEEKAIFFANTRVLTKYLTKHDYFGESQIRWVRTISWGERPTG